MVFVIFLMGLAVFEGRGFASTTDSLRLQKDNWKEVTKNIDYTENYIEQQPQNYKMPKGFSLNWVNTSLVRNIFTVIILGILAFLLYRILRNTVFNFDKKIDQKDLYQVFDENADIQDLDLDNILKDVLYKHDFKLAIRIKFLMVLKQLVNFEYIKWEKDKTNGEYLSEIRNNQNVDGFEYLVLIFERTWFGEIEITAKDFDILSVSFTNFITKLQKDE